MVRYQGLLYKGNCGNIHGICALFPSLNGFLLLSSSDPLPTELVEYAETALTNEDPSVSGLCLCLCSVLIHCVCGRGVLVLVWVWMWVWVWVGG